MDELFETLGRYNSRAGHRLHLNPGDIMRQLSSIVLLSSSLLLSASAAPFHNLGFEEAQTNKLIFHIGRGGIGYVDDLLPGWRLYISNAVQDTVFYNELNPEDPSLMVFDINGSGSSVFAPEGHFAVRSTAPIAKAGALAIAQTGDIPPSAKFLRYLYRENPFALSINGTNVPAIRPFPFATTSRGALFNVSAWSGQTVELRLTTFAATIVGLYLDYYIDSIQFLSTPPLSVARSGTDLTLSWPATITGYMLQSAEALADDTVWHDVPAVPVETGDIQCVTIPAEGQSMFYRLVPSSRLP